MYFPPTLLHVARTAQELFVADANPIAAEFVDAPTLQPDEPFDAE